jgi:hypothetical protein
MDDKTKKPLGQVDYIEKLPPANVRKKTILRNSKKQGDKPEQICSIYYKRSGHKIFKHNHTEKENDITFYDKNGYEYCRCKFDSNNHNNSFYIQFLDSDSMKSEDISSVHLERLKRLRTIFFESIKEKDGLPFDTSFVGMMNFPLALELYINKKNEKEKVREIKFPTNIKIKVEVHEEQKEKKVESENLSDFIRQNQGKDFVCPISDITLGHEVLLVGESDNKFTYVNLNGFRMSDSKDHGTTDSIAYKKLIEDSTGNKCQLIATEIPLLQSDTESGGVSCAVITHEFTLLLGEIIKDGKSPYDFVKVLNIAFWKSDYAMTPDSLVAPGVLLEINRKAYQQIIDINRTYWSEQKYPEALKYYYEKFRQLRRRLVEKWDGDFDKEKANMMERSLEKEVVPKDVSLYTSSLCREYSY